MSIKTLAALALAVFLLAARASHGEDKKPVVLKAKDGLTELHLPEGWMEAESSNPDSSIFAEHPASHVYVQVISDDRQDIAQDLKEFAESRCNVITGKMDDATTTDFQKVKLGEWSAMQCEIHGTLKKNKIRYGYVLTVIETANHYHQLVTFCSRSRFEGSKEVMLKLHEGLRETDKIKQPEK